MKQTLAAIAFLSIALPTILISTNAHAQENVMTNTKPSAILSTFLDRVSELSNAGDLFADDAVQKIPFAPEGVPKEITGPAVKQGFNGMGAMFKSLKYSNIAVLDTSDPEVAVAFAHGEATLANGAPYSQDYVFYVRVKDGKITEYREYMDPQRAAAAIAQLMGK